MDLSILSNQNKLEQKTFYKMTSSILDTWKLIFENEILAKIESVLTEELRQHSSTLPQFSSLNMNKVEVEVSKYVKNLVEYLAYKINTNTGKTIFQIEYKKLETEIPTKFSIKNKYSYIFNKLEYLFESLEVIEEILINSVLKNLNITTTNKFSYTYDSYDTSEFIKKKNFNVVIKSIYSIL